MAVRQTVRTEDATVGERARGGRIEGSSCGRGTHAHRATHSQGRVFGLHGPAASVDFRCDGPVRRHRQSRLRLDGFFCCLPTALKAEDKELASISHSAKTNPQLGPEASFRDSRSCGFHSVAQPSRDFKDILAGQVIATHVSLARASHVVSLTGRSLRNVEDCVEICGTQ